MRNMDTVESLFLKLKCKENILLVISDVCVGAACFSKYNLIFHVNTLHLLIYLAAARLVCGTQYAVRYGNWKSGSGSTLCYGRYPLVLCITIIIRFT